MQTTAPKTIRLQKFLAHAGLCSRRKAESYILQGRVKVNQEVVTVLGTQIDPEIDRVYFDNRRIQTEEQVQKIYIVVNKPRGIVTSCSQKQSHIIMDLIDISQRIYPVGRLDKESQGLVLMTNDGDLHNRLSHPSFDHEKEYVVTTRYPVSAPALKKMARGMHIDKDGMKTRKAFVKKLSEKRFKIILKEGRNRQIRKMVGKTGNQIEALKRIRMASIRLGNLKEGKWRHLTLKEIQQLKET